MIYDGPLYGKIGRKVFPTGKTAADFDRMEQMASWQPPETAPRDGSQIIGDFGWPWPLVACWDQYGQQWSVAMPAAEDSGEGSPVRFFETESVDNVELEAWMPIPELPRKGKGGAK